MSFNVPSTLVSPHSHSMSLPSMDRFLDSGQKQSSRSTCQAFLCDLLLYPLSTNPGRLCRDPLRQINPWFYHLAALLKSMWLSEIIPSARSLFLCHLSQTTFYFGKGVWGHVGRSRSYCALYSRALLTSVPLCEPSAPLPPPQTPWEGEQESPTIGTGDSPQRSFSSTSFYRWKIMKDLTLIVLFAIQERGKSYLCCLLVWKVRSKKSRNYFKGLT